MGKKQQAEVAILTSDKTVFKSKTVMIQRRLYNKEVNLAKKRYNNSKYICT